MAYSEKEEGVEARPAMVREATAARVAEGVATLAEEVLVARDWAVQTEAAWLEVEEASSIHGPLRSQYNQGCGRYIPCTNGRIEWDLQCQQQFLLQPRTFRTDYRQA